MEKYRKQCPLILGVILADVVCENIVKILKGEKREGKDKENIESTVAEIFLKWYGGGGR